MMLYNKVNKFIGKHSYLPKLMYGDESSCIIRYGIGEEEECRKLYNDLQKRIANKPYFWNNAEIKIVRNFSWNSNYKITIKANSGRLN